MSDLVRWLRCYADQHKFEEKLWEAADRIEALELELDGRRELYVARARSSRDSNLNKDKRIEALEAALREILADSPPEACHWLKDIARRALENKE